MAFRNVLSRTQTLHHCVLSLLHSHSISLALTALTRALPLSLSPHTHTQCTETHCIPVHLMVYSFAMDFWFYSQHSHFLHKRTFRCETVHNIIVCVYVSEWNAFFSSDQTINFRMFQPHLRLLTYWTFFIQLVVVAVILAPRCSLHETVAQS